ncbi:MAG: ArnT family glycosyltransferase [Candidatus Omnitrophota bacterium]
MQSMNKNFFSKKFWLSDFMIIGYFSLLTLILHLIAIKGYGYFRDEFYYLSCSDHLDFGYVDQPPLSIIILKGIRLLFGDSLVAIRILPALGASLFVFLTGWMTRELGGKKFAVALASAAAFAPLGNFFLFSFYSMNFIDYLFWSALILIVIRIIKTGNPKYWLLFGLISGLGLQNKISVLFLGFGMAAGLLLSGERKHIRSIYLWIGAGIAVLLFLPYVIWNVTHDWATLEFMSNAEKYKNVHQSPLEFLIGQFRYNSPFTLLVWLPGLFYFFFSKQGKNYRLFGWMYLAIYILFTIRNAKDYYFGGIYPILFAGGAILWEIWLNRKQWYCPKPVLISLILISALVLSPFTLPILSEEGMIKWAGMMGMRYKPQEHHEMGRLPQHFADMHGWQEMVKKVANAYYSLSPEERKECIIYATNYGVTGAVNFLGRQYGLPPAFSGHNNCFFWPPEDRTGNVIIIIGGRKENHEKGFRSVIEVDRTHCPYSMPYENNKPIYICRGLKRPLAEIWPTTKNFD